jgi:NAD-dependent deacetylase
VIEDVAPPLTKARAILDGAREILVLTGAGISSESGVPTFRGEDGLWKRYRAEDLATPEAFARDPRLVWEWYAWRRGLIRKCEPNAAHRALAGWAARRPGVTLVTQNVDGLHERAARDVSRVAGSGGSGQASGAEPERSGSGTVEIHGSIFRSRCTGCGARAPHWEPVVADALDTLPRCSICEGLLRPDVIWFGEALEEGVLALAVEAAAGADVCLVVGTSGLVHPAAGLPGLTRDQGGVVLEVNPEPTPISGIAEVSLRGRAGEVLPNLLRNP